MAESALPPYTYTPGHTPHPLSDAAGHSFGHSEPALEDFNPHEWRRCEPYVRGLRLFNRGYYWEAHEAWEAVWIAAGRKGAVADYLKALIKWAAAGVKAREGRPAGVIRHLARSAELLQSASRSLRRDDLAGQSLARLRRKVGLALAGVAGPCAQHGEPIVFWPDALLEPTGLQ